MWLTFIRNTYIMRSLIIQKSLINPLMDGAPSVLERTGFALSIVPSSIRNELALPSTGLGHYTYKKVLSGLIAVDRNCEAHGV